MGIEHIILLVLASPLIVVGIAIMFTMLVIMFNVFFLCPLAIIAELTEALIPKDKDHKRSRFLKFFIEDIQF